jgi:hypothetical protein
VLLRDPVKLEPQAFADYLRCFSNPETIRATCDEYLAGASIDLGHDRAGRGRITMTVTFDQKASRLPAFELL